MNQLSIFVLKVLRELYGKIFRVQPSSSKLICEQDPDKVSEIIFNKLMDDKPCMIARFGSTELSTLVNYLGVKQQSHNIFNYITGKSLPWWWNENLILQMQQWSGFFPPTVEKTEQFCKLTLEDTKEVDVLGSWLKEENKMLPYLPSNHQRVWRIFIDPFWSRNPWTKALEGKKILVVHPFAEIIKDQYENKRELMFKNQDILPQFDLKLVKAVQSIGGNNSGFNSWFDALDFMKREIDKVDYDICLLGCGAYGFPLAAHVKRAGKKAIHWGGSLQLFFGIIGKRWESEEYGTREAKNFCPDLSYPKLINEHWVRPESAKVSNAESIEGGCYW